jgi:hypothetical protein
MFRKRRWEGIMDSALPSRLSGLDGAIGRGRCVSGRSVLEALLSNPSKSRSRSGMCTLGRTWLWSLVLCLRLERGSAPPACVPTWNTGSVRRELIDGRL